MNYFTIKNKYLKKRLDIILTEKIKQLNRSQFKILIKTKKVKINDKYITNPSYKAKINDTIIIQLPEIKNYIPSPEKISLKIIYEDNDLIILNKSANMVVHPAPGHLKGTLVNALLYYYGSELSNINGIKRPGIVHRLDQKTSGLMVVAKNNKTHIGLAAQFANHGLTNNLKRLYQAVVWNNPIKLSSTINTQIGRSINNRIKMAVFKNKKKGKTAITYYKVIKKLGIKNKNNQSIASLIECQLKTGRTHQIRVHMEYIGCPLLGDNIYGKSFKTSANKLNKEANNALINLNRQALHAKTLNFDHPITGDHMKFEDDLPQDILSLISKI